MHIDLMQSRGLIRKPHTPGLLEGFPGSPFQDLPQPLR